MQRWTHRQYIAVLAWMQEQWNRPDRTDHYLMQVAFQVCRSTAKHPGQVKYEKFKINFSVPGEEKAPSMTPEQEAIYAKAKWAARMTMPITVVTVPRADPDETPDLSEPLPSP